MPVVKYLSYSLLAALMHLSPANVAAQTPPAVTQVATAAAPTVTDAVKTAEAARDSLAALVKAFEQEAEQMAQKNAQIKQLYSEGIMSRTELEASDKALADARKKVEDTREQVKEADAAIAAARSLPDSDGERAIASNKTRAAS